jgi:short-subunit dehydrogenase involved in D-alanine esterification of teichoic acids
LLARTSPVSNGHVRVFEALPPIVDTGPVGDLRVPKLPPAAVADAIIDALSHDREEIRIRRVRQLAPLARLAPRLADRIVTRALGSA